MKDTIIVDIDGTLCDISQRLHLVSDPRKKAWKEFFAAIHLDEPRQDIITLVNTLSKAYKICLVSGRPEDYAEQTLKWLSAYGVTYDSIDMRKQGDYRPDTIVKKEILDAKFDKSRVMMVIDDRPRVIQMWRDQGLLVLDVGKGVDF